MAHNLICYLHISKHFPLTLSPNSQTYQTITYPMYRLTADLLRPKRSWMENMCSIQTLKIPCRRLPASWVEQRLGATTECLVWHFLSTQTQTHTRNIQNIFPSHSPPQRLFLAQSRLKMLNI